MAIDAIVKVVKLNDDGSGYLLLADRPPKPGQSAGIAGQTHLHFEASPEEVTSLKGLEVWGSADTLVLGEKEIAKRTGYTTIVFVSKAHFKAAIAAYHKCLQRKRFLCERCGGTNQQPAGCFNYESGKYDSPAGKCDDCEDGYLGEVPEPLG